MYLLFTASADNYITNKIISTSVSASDANVGQASTLDLFKIYDETVFTGYTGSFSAPTEISRVLIKFDISEISRSISPYAELDSVSCYLSLKDINGSLISPKKFNIIAFPLSASFDEGRGKDIYSFNDLDRSNWYTASYSNSADVPWKSPGARAEGFLNATDIDVIGSGSIGGTVTTLYGEQYFEKGHEDLLVDVTTAVSATMGGFMSDHGFCIAYSGSEETDAKTRFVKRFGSRHVRDYNLRPTMIVTYDDSKIDQRHQLRFNRSGSLFLTNHSYGYPANLISGSAASEIKGDNSLKVVFYTGSFAVTSSASQYKPANKYLDGVYKADVAFDEFSDSVIWVSSSFSQHVAHTGSLVINERWEDSSQKVTFYSGSFKVEKDKRYVDNTSVNYRLTITNLQSKYKPDEINEVRIFVRDISLTPLPVRKNHAIKSILLPEVYYRIRDTNTGKVVVPFTKTRNATRLSSDESGMYFNFSTKSLALGRLYTFDFLVVLGNNELCYETKSSFRVEK